MELLIVIILLCNYNHEYQTLFFQCGIQIIPISLLLKHRKSKNKTSGYYLNKNQYYD